MPLFCCRLCQVLSTQINVLKLGDGKQRGNWHQSSTANFAFGYVNVSIQACRYFRLGNGELISLMNPSMPNLF